MVLSGRFAFFDLSIHLSMVLRLMLIILAREPCCPDRGPFLMWLLQIPEF